MRYGMNVIMDVINLSVEMSERNKDGAEEVIDVSASAVDMEG